MVDEQSALAIRCAETKASSEEKAEMVVAPPAAGTVATARDEGSFMPRHRMSKYVYVKQETVSVPAG
jgi:hypothetical protein